MLCKPKNSFLTKKRSFVHIVIRKTICCLFIFLLAFGTNICFAQQAQQQPQPTVKSGTFGSNWLLSPSIGFGQFYGDISSQNFFQKFSGGTAFALDFTARKMFSPTIGVGGNLYYTGVKSLKNSMGDGTPVAFYLTGHYFDVNFRGYVDFTNLFTTFEINRHLSLVGSLGIGYGLWSTTLTDSLTGTSVSSGQLNGTNQYKKSALVVPVGLVGSYRLTEKWSVDLGVDFRTILNDDVDIWHDGFKYDQLLFVKVGVTYSIGYGWRSAHRAKPTVNAKEEPCCDETQPLAPIPVYDYMPPSKSSPETSGKKPSVSETNVGKNPETATVTIPKGFEYRVQIMAKAERRDNPDRLQARYHLDYPVIEHYQDGLYRYTVGHFNSYNKALEAARQIKAKGVFDAFVTAYLNGQRVRMTKAMRK